MPEIVVIGGGAVGCGVAYSLAKAGKTDIVVLEKEPTLAAMTTSQAAGLVGQVRASVERVKLAMWSVKTFTELQASEKAPPAWRQVGSLRVALSEKRAAEFAKLKKTGNDAGLEVDLIDRREAAKKWPMMNFDSATAILWCPSDGYLQPYDLTMAYATHARQLGVRFQTNTVAQNIDVRDGRVQAVETQDQTIECQTVVNAAGAHAYHIAKLVGVELPIIPVRHEFLVTIHAEGLDPLLPVVRVPEVGVYLRSEVGALLLGGFEPEGLSTDPRGYELSSDAPLLEPAWDALAYFSGGIQPMLPQVDELGVREIFKGWPTFTPDGRFIVGPTKHVDGFVMAGGCNAHGVSGSAGIGRHVTESMLKANPSAYVQSLSPDRFIGKPWQWETAQREAQQIYEQYYS
jgi:glycine/D-amino acid oxidase-like deaminating enzyme